MLLELVLCICLFLPAFWVLKLTKLKMYNNYDDTQVNLGNEFGVRFAIPIKIKIRKHSLIVAPYYEIIDIGKSNTVRVTSGGAATTTFIYEPRSETRNIGINITWVW